MTTVSRQRGGNNLASAWLPVQHTINDGDLEFQYLDHHFKLEDSTHTAPQTSDEIHEYVLGGISDDEQVINVTSIATTAKFAQNPPEKSPTSHQARGMMHWRIP